MKDVKLYCGDCLDMMRQIPNGCVDMVLTDPPYSSGGLFAGDRKMDTRTKYTSCEFNGAARFKNFTGDNMDQRSFTEFCRTVFAQARQKTKDGAILASFVDWRQLPAMTDAIQMAGWVWRGIAVWDKGNARNTPGRFRQDCEFIVWGTNGKKEVDWKAYKGKNAVAGCYHIPPVNARKKNHQTEKPVVLLEKLLEILPPDRIVLDPFMGSGSTGVACASSGHGFIGIELDADYYDTARQRVKEAYDNVERNRCI